MRSAHTVAQVRAAEDDLMTRVPEGTLMRRAAYGLAVAIADLLGGVYGRRVLLLVGSGNNGGDALWAGAFLARRGARVEAVLLNDRHHTEGLAALRASGGRIVTLDMAHTPDVVVDGIVGIGGQPGLRPDAAAAVDRFPDAWMVAVDVPSGVEVDTGRVAGPHVRADLTVTFGTYKIAHLVDPAAAACGVIEPVDIGLTLPRAPVEALQRDDVAALLPRPGAFAHKYTRGVVGVRAGSAAYPGAAVLCTAGAAAGLAGMVRYVGPAAATAAVIAAHPGVVATAGRVQAWVVGSGTHDTAAAVLAEALADGVPTVIDADALAHLPDRLPAGTVLTPHAGELAGLLSISRAEVEESQLATARAAAERFGAVVVSKNRHTVIAAPGTADPVRVTTTGLSWLATAGTGDVLAGIIGALLAGGLSAFDAASVGSWLHGAAATHASRSIGFGPITPLAVATALPAVIVEASQIPA